MKERKNIEARDCDSIYNYTQLKSILQNTYFTKRSSEKDLAPPPEECLQLISRATQVFREQYILKQNLAKEEIQRR